VTFLNAVSLGQCLASEMPICQYKISAAHKWPTDDYYIPVAVNSISFVTCALT